MSATANSLKVLMRLFFDLLPSSQVKDKIKIIDNIIYFLNRIFGARVGDGAQIAAAGHGA